MKKELIQELFEKFETACYILNGIECWSARELQIVFNYTDWRNFLKVIDKAKTACENSGVAVSDHFVDISKMVELGSGSQREIEDVALTRYACYLNDKHYFGQREHNTFSTKPNCKENKT